MVLKLFPQAGGTGISDAIFILCVSGNIERGWNDPPVFLHSVTDSKPGESVTPGKRTLLTKRVAHAGLYGNTTNNPSLTNSQQSDSSGMLTIHNKQ